MRNNLKYSGFCKFLAFLAFLSFCIYFTQIFYVKKGLNFLEFKSRSTVVLNKKILYFGVTHHSTIDGAMMADKTWARRLMPEGFPWYSDEPDKRIDNLTVISSNSFNSYEHLYFRVLEIWKDVYKKFPGYDWYVRTWDDNFIFKERIEEIAQKLSSRVQKTTHPPDEGSSCSNWEETISPGPATF